MAMHVVWCGNEHVDNTAVSKVSQYKGDAMSGVKGQGDSNSGCSVMRI